ncbi:MAG: hypothetical protein JO128_01045, partial [Alphaproteobacteria bacterium]|nr:hypothetical protein [Alphaproteobacteria bacterium]
MPTTLWVRLCTTTILATSLLGAGAALAADPPPQTQPPSQDEILRELRAMAARITALEQELRAEKAAHAAAPAKAPTAAAPIPASTPFTAQAPAASPPAVQPQPAAAQAKPAEDKGLFGLAPSPIEGLTFGAYGELKYGGKQNPSANGQWQTGFDAARVVLLPSYQITDDIVFNAEIEFEHAGSGF